jgi:hypothetical protein
MNEIKKHKDLFVKISLYFAKIRKFIYSTFFDNMVLKRIFAIVIFALCITPQAFSSKPVTVMVSLSPPYTPFLHEYASAGAHKLQVSLLVNDSRMVNYPVKLQMLVEHVGSGIVMRTAEYAAIAPVLLTGNVTEILSGFDLSSYFRAQNLVFSGFDQSQYVQTGRIPDGQYRIGFRVVDAQRPEVVLSNTAYTQAAWFVLNEPPQVNMPRNNEKVRVQDVQNVKLEWFPRHVGSLNGAFATQYQVELYAIRVPGMNPNQVVMSMQPDYTYVTNRTSYMLTNAEYMLEPGVEYALRIKAMAGNDELTLFHNNGYSAVTSFIYGSLCPEPADVSAQTIGTDKVEISWTTDPLHTSFTTRFRKAGNATDTWHSRQSYSGMVEISNVLQPGEEYEYQVKAQCMGAESDYATLEYVTLPNLPPPGFTCGVKDAVRVRNTTPKQYLKSGDMIYSGQFPVKLTEVSGGNGVFSGKGRMRIPFLANIQVNMTFANIKVNVHNEVYEGELVSVYNPDSELLVDDITDYLAEGDQIGNIIDGVDSAAVTLDFTIDDVFATDVRISGNTLTIQSGGDQATVTIEHGEEGTTIKDAEGNLYAVDQSGVLSRIGKSGGNAAQQIGFSTDSLDDEREIRFSNAGTWAFDSLAEVYAQSKFAEEFEQIDGFIIPWKFVPVGKADKVQIHFTKGNIDLDKVTFTTPSGTEFYAERSGDEIVLTLIGAKERDGYELYAVYQEDDSTTSTIGKLNIASYPLVDRFVTIVPMHDKTIDKEQLSIAVNKIYKPYGIRWHIEIDNVFTDRSWDTDVEGLQATGSELYSEFTAEMRALNNQYVTQRGIDEKSVYIFWFAERPDSENLLGDMPLKSRFGYLFSPAIEGAHQTIAHELAHGAFQLRHTFSERYSIAKNSTPNLMDYARGNELTKYQWDLIHDPQKMLFPWMQGEEEGRFKITTHQNLVVTAISKIDGNLVLNERNFKLLIATGLLADGGSILCDINREMSNAELTEELSTYLNSKLDDMFKIYNSPMNVIEEQWIEFWSTSIEFPNMQNIFRRSWQYGLEMKQTAEIFTEYAQAIYSSDIKFEKLIITPNNKFKIELKDLTLLEDPDLCFNLLFRMHDYVTVNGELKTLSLNGEGLDLIPQWISSDVNVSTQSSLGITYVNKETKKVLFEITFDVNASLVNSVELVMSLNGVQMNFPLTCETERIDIHFDNKYTSSEVLAEWSKIDNQLSKLTDLSGNKAIDMGLILHNVADFYSHSNFITEYISWWMEQPNTNIKTLKPEHIPTYKELVSNAINQWGLDWGAFWSYYKPIMQTGSWDLGGEINTEKKAKLPKPHHDEINLDASDKGKGGEKPDDSALCNYFEYARGVTYKHIYEILKSKLK